MVDHLHIVGAGLAGLSAAVHARQKGIPFTIYEASPQAGGRIRKVGNHDNGTHLIAKGYAATFEYLEMIGASSLLLPYHDPAYRFVEPQSGLNWRVKANHFIWQVAKGSIPGVNATNVMKETAMRRLWEPFFLAVFNTPLKDVPGSLVRQTFLELLRQGPSSLIPYFAAETLYDTFIAPALLEMSIEYGQRLCAVEKDTLVFKEKRVHIGKDERVILALPLQAYRHIEGPFDFSWSTFSPITNIHFELPKKVDETFIGLIGCQSQWLYAKNNHACVTISHYKSESQELEKRVWAEIAPLLQVSNCEMPSSRIVCEKFATPMQDAAFTRNRVCARTDFSKVFLAGDWIDTGLPATIESAIRSAKVSLKEACVSK